LQVEIDVFLLPGHHATQAAQPLRDALGWTCRPDGDPPFFDPDDFSFGMTVYRSRLVYRAVKLQGVARVEVRAFCRLGEDPAGEEIVLQPVEVPRLDILRIDWLGLSPADGQAVPLPNAPAGRLLLGERFLPAGSGAGAGEAAGAGSLDSGSSQSAPVMAAPGTAGMAAGAPVVQLPAAPAGVDVLGPDQGTFLIHLWGLL
jgi:hypothetical protein